MLGHFGRMIESLGLARAAMREQMDALSARAFVDRRDLETAQTSIRGFIGHADVLLAMLEEQEAPDDLLDIAGELRAFFVETDARIGAMLAAGPD
jgi:hypothetical protein